MWITGNKSHAPNCVNCWRVYTRTNKTELFKSNLINNTHHHYVKGNMKKKDGVWDQSRPSLTLPPFPNLVPWLGRLGHSPPHSPPHPPFATMRSSRERLGLTGSLRRASSKGRPYAYTLSTDNLYTWYFVSTPFHIQYIHYRFLLLLTLCVWLSVLLQSHGYSTRDDQYLFSLSSYC